MKRSKIVSSGLVLSSVAIAIVVLFGLIHPNSGQAQSAEIRVCKSGCQFSRIQDAVDSASYGGTVSVGPGTYTDLVVRTRTDTQTTGVVTQVVYVTKSLTIRALDPENRPVIDPHDKGRGIYIAGPITVELESLKIVGGNPYKMGGGPSYQYDDNGGGVYAYQAAVTVAHATFSGNVASGGPAIYSLFGSLRLIDSEVVSNTAYHSGAVFFDYGLGHRIERSSFVNNVTTWGGALYTFSTTVQMQQSVVLGNSALAYGGCARLVRSTLESSRSVYRLNASNGDKCLSGDLGAIFVSENDVIADHLLEQEMPAAELIHESAIQGTTTFKPTPIPAQVDNHILPSLPSRGVSTGWVTVNMGQCGRIYGSHLTLVNNAGGPAILVPPCDSGTPAILTNTIIASNSLRVEGFDNGSNFPVLLNGLLLGENGEVQLAPGGKVVSSTVIRGDPKFVDPAAGDYHLRVGSAAIDTGVPANVSIDFDGQVRDALPDIGADEWSTSCRLPKSVLYLIDTSISMEENGSAAVDRGVNFATAMVDHMLKSDSGGVVVYSKTARLTEPLSTVTSTKAALVNLLGTKPNGSTNLLAALNIADQQLARSERSVVVMVGDGEADDVSGARAKMNALKSQGITLIYLQTKERVDAFKQDVHLYYEPAELTSPATVIEEICELLPQPELTVSKVAPVQIDEGQRFEYHLAVTNTGNTVLDGMVTDFWPPELYFEGRGRPAIVTWTFTLQSRQVWQMTIRALAPASIPVGGKLITNTVSVSTTQGATGTTESVILVLPVTPPPTQTPPPTSTPIPQVEKVYLPLMLVGFFEPNIAIVIEKSGSANGLLPDSDDIVLDVAKLVAHGVIKQTSPGWGIVEAPGPGQAITITQTVDRDTAVTAVNQIVYSPGNNSVDRYLGAAVSIHPKLVVWIGDFRQDGGIGSFFNEVASAKAAGLPVIAVAIWDRNALPQLWIIDHLVYETAGVRIDLTRGDQIDAVVRQIVDEINSRLSIRTSRDLTPK